MPTVALSSPNTLDEINKNSQIFLLTVQFQLFKLNPEWSWGLFSRTTSCDTNQRLLAGKSYPPLPSVLAGVLSWLWTGQGCTTSYIPLLKGLSPVLWLSSAPRECWENSWIHFAGSHRPVHLA